MSATSVIERPAAAPPRTAGRGRAQRCPRCGGNLFLSREHEAPEWQCLQCGRSFGAPTPAVHQQGRRSARPRAA